MIFKIKYVTSLNRSPHWSVSSKNLKTPILNFQSEKVSFLKNLKKNNFLKKKFNKIKKSYLTTKIAKK